jgi:protein gp37
VPNHPFEQGFGLRLVPEKLDLPLRWRSPRRIFVNSMSDLFHEDIPVDYIAAVARVMKAAHWHVFQVLTKRHDRLHDLVSGELSWLGRLSNVWFGVSVEDRAHGLPRIPTLQRTSVGVRFLSIEPLLEDLGTFDLEGIDWVIVGGESGPSARRMEEEWVLKLLDLCQAAGVPFFFKQWGGTRKSKSGRSLLGRTWDEMPRLNA